MAKLLAQGPDTGAQIVERGLVGSTPRSGANFRAWGAETGMVTISASSTRSRFPGNATLSPPGSAFSSKPPKRRSDQRGAHSVPSLKAEAEFIGASNRSLAAILPSTSPTPDAIGLTATEWVSD